TAVTFEAWLRQPTTVTKSVNATKKEQVKDSIRVKVHGKDPIHDGTVKEQGKDPFLDATLEEAALSPGLDPRVGPNPNPLRRMPFVLATPQQAPGLAGQQDDVTQLAQAVQQLGDALAAVDQERVVLATQYEAAANELRRLLAEQGG